MESVAGPRHKWDLSRQSFERSAKEMGRLVLVWAAWWKKDPAGQMIRLQQRRWKGEGQFPWKTEWLSLTYMSLGQWFVESQNQVSQTLFSSATQAASC